MNIDLRRSHRNVEYLPIGVNIIHGMDGSVLAGPYSGRIIDFSNHGACLLMTQVIMDRYHVFHTTKEDDSNLLQLVIPDPSGEEDAFQLNARPVWITPFQQQEARAFRLGIEFLVSPDGKLMNQVVEALEQEQNKRGALWEHVSNSS